MAGAPQSNQGAEGSSGILWIIAAIFVFGGVIWYVYKKQMVSFYFLIKLWEVKLISLFTNRLDDLSYVMLNSDPAQFSFTEVMKVGAAVGYYLRIPFVMIMIALAVLIFLTNSTRVFKRIYTMRDLVQLEKDNWPQITPIAHLDLLKTDIDKGPWAMAATPMQFCKRHRLLEEYRRAPQEGMTHKEWNKTEVALRRGEANKVFAIQLGPMWPGLNRIPPHIKALFAAFAARVNGDGKGAADLFAHMSRSAATKLDFSGTDELLLKHKDTKLVKRVMESHAYLLTVMASMLEVARSDGVQASADFLWLKPVDRRLWYMLNTVGRQTPFVEVAGPFAHWVAEKELGKKILAPMIDEATNALDVALKEVVYRPDESA